MMLGTLEVNKVHNMDCLRRGGIDLIPDGSIDLVITDPPYMMAFQSNRRKEKYEKIQNDVDSFELIRNITKEYHRVLKDNSSIYMFCSWHHIDFFKQEFEKYFSLKNIIVWNKNNHGTGDLKGSYAPKHEFCLYGHKGKDIIRAKRVPDVIDCDKVSGSDSTHPTEKPIDLLNIFVQNSSNKGDIILDCFAGTGSSLLAALYNERNAIGFEIDSSYADIANKRIDEVVSGSISKKTPKLKVTTEEVVNSLFTCGD